MVCLYLLVVACRAEPSLAIARLDSAWLAGVWTLTALLTVVGLAVAELAVAERVVAGLFVD
jgi:hypothetical protein